MITPLKPLIYMVEPSGIEPLTSTLPVLMNTLYSVLSSAYTVLYCTFYVHTTLCITLLHPFLVALRCDHRNHNPHHHPLPMGAKPLFRVIRYLKLSVTCVLDITRRAP